MNFLKSFSIILSSVCFLNVLIYGLAIAEENVDPSTLSPDKLTAKDFDHPSLQGNNNGRLEYEEFVRFQLRKQNPPFNVLDKNGDFEVSWEEKLEWAEIFGMDYFPNESSITFEDANTTLPTEDAEAFGFGDTKKGLGRLRLGSDYKGLLQGLKKSNPASFGYYYDNHEEDSTWAVEGTLGVVRNIYTPKAETSFGNYTLDPIRFIPAVTINRISGTGGGTVSEVDAMVFRAGLAWGLRNDSYGANGTIFDHQLFSVSYRAAGTTDADDFNSALEVFWEPMRNRSGEFFSLNGPYRAFSADPEIDPESQLFLYRLVFGGKLEGGEASEDDDTFVKLGPTIGLYLRPNFWPKAELFANYSYFWELSNNSDDFDYLDTGIRVALDELSQVFVEAKYRKGQVPSKYTDIDLWQVVFSIKF